MPVDKYGQYYSTSLYCGGTPDPSRLHEVVADGNERGSWSYDGSSYVPPCPNNSHKWYQCSRVSDLCSVCSASRPHLA